MNISQCPIIIFLLPLLGCGGTSESTLLNVSAALAETTCGGGALDTQDNWNSQVRLRKEGNLLTWYDVRAGTYTYGSVDDGEFSVSDSRTYEISAATAASRGCSVRRHDYYSGDATFDKEDNVTKLEGDIAFKYTQATGYDCDTLIGAADGFDDLPCEVDYTFVATPG